MQNNAEVEICTDGMICYGTDFTGLRILHPKYKDLLGTNKEKSSLGHLPCQLDLWQVSLPPLRLSPHAIQITLLNRRFADLILQRNITQCLQVYTYGHTYIA